MSKPAKTRLGFALALLLLASAGKGGELFLTAEPQDPPFSMEIDGQPSGLAATILRPALKRAGVPYEISVHPWMRAYDMALKTPQTCVYATTPTEQRRPLFKWIGPLFAESWVLFATADSPIHATTLDELRGLRIGGSQGAAQTIYLQTLGVPIDVLSAVDNMSDNLRKLLAGHIDLWATGLKRGSYTAKIMGAKIKPVLALRQVELYLACNRSTDDTVITRVNAVLADMRADGTIARLSLPYQ